MNMMSMNNIMMNRMRAFFRNVITTAMGGTLTVDVDNKSAIGRKAQKEMRQ